MSFASKEVSSCYYREVVRGFIILLFLALWAAPAEACSVPVFRYALERWAADRFSGVLFVNGKLTDAQDEAYTSMVRAADAPAAGLNLDVVKVDVAGEIPAKFRRIWKEQEGAAGGKLPWVVIRYPALVGEEQRVLWAGPLESEEVAGMFSSPGREELGRRLMKGEALVFVLVESGQKERDERAGKLIEEQIPVLEKTVKVSKVIEDDPLVEGPTLKSKLPVALKMSLLRVSREDAREKMLVRMLEGSQSGAINREMPVVYPVFGRGRILCAFSGESIKAENLEDAAAFLAGPCSCQVKELNPGVDILMAADWESVIEDREAVAPRIARVVIPEPKIAGGSKPRVAATQPAAGAVVVESHFTAVAMPIDKILMLKIAISVTSVVMIVLGLMLIMRQKREGR